MMAETPRGATASLPPPAGAPRLSVVRALPSGLYCLRWMFDSHASSPGLACIPGRLLPGLCLARGLLGNKPLG